LIIDGADRLREAAANSTLKILEEPPETSLIILVTSKPYALLETIRSRCQLLNFGPLTAAEIESRLRASEKGSAEDLRLRARLARGSIGRAMAVDLEQYREERKVPLQLLESLALRPDTADLLNAAEYLGRQLERKEFEEHMDAFVTLLNDAFYLKLGLPADSITNLDIVNRLERIAEMMTLDRIIALAEHNEQMIQALNRNINRQLALEAMLISV
jgi:DNA polymerase-3 subunit delta'